MPLERVVKQHVLLLLQERHAFFETLRENTRLRRSMEYPDFRRRMIGTLRFVLALGL